MSRCISRLTSGFWLLAFGLSGTASCARPVFVLPTGAGVPAPEARSVWSDATRNCREVGSLSAELRLSGHAGTTKIGGTRILAGLTTDGNVFLEVPAPFGRPVFVIAGNAERATLLSRDNHVLTARADDILDAFVGLRLGPSTLVPILAGCGTLDEPSGDPIRFTDILSFGTAGKRIFVSSGVVPRVVAAETAGWLIDYPGDAIPPNTIRIRSVPGREPAIDLTVGVSQLELNARLPPAAFTLVVPPGAQPLTLADLRASGPLGARR
jgi:hypothetical protein